MTQLPITVAEEKALQIHVDQRLKYYIKLGVDLGMDVDQYFVDHEIGIAEGKAKLKIKIEEAKVQLQMLNTIIYFSCGLVAGIYLTKIAFAMMNKPIDLSENYFLICYFTIAFSVIGRYFNIVELAPWFKAAPHVILSKGTKANEKQAPDLDITISPDLRDAISRGVDITQQGSKAGQVQHGDSAEVGESYRVPRGISKRVKDK